MCHIIPYHTYHTQHLPSVNHQFFLENIIVKDKSVDIIVVFTITCPRVDPIQRSILNLANYCAFNLAKPHRMTTSLTTKPAH